MTERFLGNQTADRWSDHKFLRRKGFCRHRLDINLIELHTRLREDAHFQFFKLQVNRVVCDFGNLRAHEVGKIIKREEHKQENDSRKQHQADFAFVF
ncbi:hypothetical protein D3C87_1956880 [compost metagenome]